MKTFSSSKAAGLSLCAALVALLGAPAMAQPPAQAPAAAPRPPPPGPPVAGHWSGQMVLILKASKREVPVPLDFKLTQDGNTVTGLLTYTSSVDHTVKTREVRGIEEEGKLNLLWDFNEREHCRLHLTIDGDTLNGELFNFHDNPRSWGADETGPVTLKRAS